MHRRVSRRGRGGGGIHRCGSLGADDCGLIDRGGRISAGTFYVKRASAPTRETYKGRLLAYWEKRCGSVQPLEDSSTLISLSCRRRRSFNRRTSQGPFLSKNLNKSKKDSKFIS